MIKFRLIFLSCLFFLLFGVIIFRAFQLQLLPQDRLENLAKRQFEQKVEITGRRGSLVDREGKELAISTNSLSLFANPRLVSKPRVTAQALSKALNLSERSLLTKLDDPSKKSESRRFVWLHRQLNAAQMQALQKIDLKKFPGVGVLPEFRREYPNGSLAAHLLGFVSVDGDGREGVEKKFDGNLKGSRNVVALKKDALGRPLFSQADQARLESSHGSRIELTIDANLQYSAERALDEAVNHHQAVGGSIVVMDPHNGDILALASMPTYNPNEAALAAIASRRNRALTDPIEPGSVLKPFVVARALEDKIVRPESIISGGNGFIKVGNKIIGEADEKHRMSSMSIVDLIRLSSNVGTVVLQQKLGYPKVEDTFLKLGFGSLTGLGIGAESKGLFPRLKENQKLEQATVSFGQGLAVTPMQMAVAYSSLANGGYRVKPRLIRKIISDKGVQDFSKDFSKEKLPKVFSAETVEKMQKILEKVVEGEGTGTQARVESFKVAGKTGTAQKVNYKKGGYESGAYWSSFAGFLPADNPRFVIYVLIDQPTRNGYYGGQVAAPVFSKVARAAIRFFKTELPSKEKAAPVLAQNAPSVKTRLSTPERKNTASGKMPDLVGLPLSRAFRVMQSQAQRVEIIGEGTLIDAQMPAAGVDLNSDHVIYLKVR